MLILLCFICYLTWHLIFYFVLSSKFRYLQTERTIFLYHFISFIIASLIFAVYSFVSSTEQAFILLFGIMATHGIYSLTFLELWSLSQGSYSLQVLQSCATTPHLNADKLQELHIIGDNKFCARLSSIENMGLIHSSSTEVTLTTSGKFIALILLGICKLTNLNDRG